MDEIKTANLTMILFWVGATGVLLALGQIWPRLRGFRACMLAQWKAALVISLLFLAGMALGGRGGFNVYALAIFCEALIGLALARQVGREPLPVAAAVQTGRGAARRRSGAVQEQRGAARAVGLSVLFALLAAAAAFLVGSIGLSIMQSITHETVNTRDALNNFAVGPLQALGAFFSGAGIAEETLFRLCVLSLLWRWLGKPGWAVALSALLFGAYHLTPLSGMYQSFWQYPVSQFVASTLIGGVWGWLFVRRGYETCVLAHTLSDWLPMLIFA
jgi:membrane protease YdiL (CAAX protease family)